MRLTKRCQISIYKQTLHFLIIYLYRYHLNLKNTLVRTGNKQTGKANKHIQTLEQMKHKYHCNDTTILPQGQDIITKQSLLPLSSRFSGRGEQEWTYQV